MDLQLECQVTLGGFITQNLINQSLCSEKIKVTNNMIIIIALKSTNKIHYPFTITCVSKLSRQFSLSPEEYL